MKKPKLTGLKTTALQERKNSSPIRGSELIKCAAVSALPSAFEKSTNRDYSNHKCDQWHPPGAHPRASMRSGPPGAAVLRLALRSECPRAHLGSSHPSRPCQQLQLSSPHPWAWACVGFCTRRHYSLKEPKDSTAWRPFYDFNTLMYYLSLFKITVNA